MELLWSSLKKRELAHLAGDHLADAAATEQGIHRINTNPRLPRKRGLERVARHRGQWPLRLMRRADGSWMSMVDHYQSCATPLAAARAAVDELDPGARLGRPGEPSGHKDPVYDTAPWELPVGRGVPQQTGGVGAGQGSTSWRTHNRVHRWVGGHMMGDGSVNDPAFWLHHAFVDLLWFRWQRRYPNSRYLPAKPLGRGDAQHRRVIARTEEMPPWNITPNDVDDYSKIYRYA
ncbi:tyrosinase family oxidase copper chaperone [Streptomyces sp. NPDC096046]|uniref:tyrosinase family oxidase copper chaperone n=1 Tax=Streptomyces sp. NPDC096046 TaxID=3155542 RepID=UPI00332CCDEA